MPKNKQTYMFTQFKTLTSFKLVNNNQLQIYRVVNSIKYFSAKKKAKYIEKL